MFQTLSPNRGIGNEKDARAMDMLHWEQVSTQKVRDPTSKRKRGDSNIVMMMYVTREKHQ